MSSSARGAVSTSSYQQSDSNYSLGISVSNDSEPARLRKDQRPTYQPSGPSSAPPTQSPRLPDRPNLPMRSSTTGSQPDSDHPSTKTTIPVPQPRSADHNHAPDSWSRSDSASGSAPDSSPVHLSSSSTRPTSPASSSNHHYYNAQQQMTSSEDNRRKSAASLSSAASDSTRPGAPAPAGSPNLSSSPCSACGKQMQGAFVRALGTVFHLNCFNCMDCGDVVASKFFPIDGPDGKQFPLCEKDYFRRLNLICAKCETALRGSYITACNKKFHVEHFTCSICPTLFGPEDSYYEHENDVYCHFHYSTRFATKCAGCNTAILKQFVEINRNMRDECWHPECYMINKFWNVKVTSRRTASMDNGSINPAYMDEERRETAASLKEKQIRMEQQVYRIWTVLSAFEESSAACISDMLRQVSNGQYLDAIRMAEKFILHVEVLFATIDDLEFQFAQLSLKGMSHVREARMLCRKTVDLFTLLSHTQETGARRMGMTQELLALVTGLAHYLKILIRIALTGALKLEREQNVPEAMSSFLDRLHFLAVQGGNPGAPRMVKTSNGAVVPPSRNRNPGTQGVTYGFKSLAPENAGESPFSLLLGSNGHANPNPSSGNGVTISASNPPSDLCVECGLTVEEDCVRLGTYQRWHSQCMKCMTCGKVAAAPLPKDKAVAVEDKDKAGEKTDGPKLSTVRRPPANVGAFVYEVDSRQDTGSFGEVPKVILCTDHTHPGCRGGFQAVSRLEQYAFLLNVALRRLYLLLKKQGVLPLSPVATCSSGPHNQANTDSDPYRNSGDFARMKSVYLDRKLSATARLPKRSTVIESPTGKSVHPSDALHLQRSQDLRYAQTRSPPVGPQQSPQTPRAQPGKSCEPAHAPPPLQLPQPQPSRNTTQVNIVDESVPSTSGHGTIDDDVTRRGSSDTAHDDSIMLADIGQMMAAAQAREQRRSLPCESSIPYIAELNPLELAIVRHAAVLALYQSPLRDQFDLEEILDLLELKKGGFFYKLFKTGNDKKNVKKKGVFGVPLELLVEREGADSLLGATRSTMRVPSFIDDVISAMRQMDMSIEGIFRKNGNIRRLKDLTEAIDREPSSVDLSQDNPVQLAALLKKFLRDLPDPLLTFKLQRLFIASQNIPQEAERTRLLHMVSLILPKSHRDTMEVLFVFLKWVASFAHMDEETGSKMDLQNLATVICPSILYARGRDAVRDDSFSAIRVVTSLLEHQDEFYTVPYEFLPLLDDQAHFMNSMELPSKDFLKKCETYMRQKANGRPPPISTPSTSGQFGHPASQAARVPGNGERQPTANAGVIDPPRNNGNIRQPHPGMPPPSGSYAPPQSQTPRNDNEWSANPPRPHNMSPSPRPASWAPVKLSDDPSHPQTNGYGNGERVR